MLQSFYRKTGQMAKSRKVWQILAVGSSQNVVFYRVDKSCSKAIGGTGLGLAIVKHIVAIHDAKIELDSAPGVGTTISVLF